MTYLEHYLSKINDNEQAVSITDTAQSFIQKINEHLPNGLTGLLLGNVQSGKTSQMLGVIAKMADNGFRIFILLTTDNVDLQRQTFRRVKNSLSEFNVLDERDEVEFEKVKLSKPLVVVLKKNSRVLRKWKNILVNSRICLGQSLTIFDDEADNASLNTLVNRDRVSPINSILSQIKQTAVSSNYIEVTATPQAVILQSSISGWKPDFVHFFKPGKGYLGGDFFYSEPRPYCINFTDEFEIQDVLSDDDIPCPKGLQDSIASFLMICAYKKLQGESNCNFVVHPSVQISAHNKFVTVIQDQLSLLQKSSGEDEFIDLMKDTWDSLQKTKPNVGPFEDLLEEVVDILDNAEIFTTALNSQNTEIRDRNNPDALDLGKGFNIIVGGNTLGRGITFPHLQVVYYCRSSKVPQADTYWQHSRIFGYDRDPGLSRIFIPPHLFQLFANLNKANDNLIRQIVDNVNEIQIIYPEDINPTRFSVLDSGQLNLVHGGVNIFQSMPTGINVDTVNKLVEGFEVEETVECDSNLIIQLLSLLPSESIEDFDTNKYITSVSSICKARPKVKSRLIVRLDRDIAKGTGTLLSPTDRILGDKYPSDIVLTIYRVKGSKNKGWAGKPLWIPNIKFPSSCVIYSSK